MKIMFTLAALSAITVLSATTCPYGGRGNFQNRGYYQQGYNAPRGNYADEDGYYDDNPRYRDQQGYYDDNMKGSYRDRDQQGYYDDSEYRQNRSPRYWDNQQGYNDNRQNRYSNQDYMESRKTATFGSDSSQDSQMSAGQDSAANDSDRQLNSKIRERLSSARIRGYETLVFRTNNGVVVISGSVDSPEDMQKINEKLKDIRGIKSLRNQVITKQQQMQQQRY